MIKKLIDKILTKIAYGGIEFGDHVYSLIQAEELIKLKPEIADKYPMRYDEFREIIKNRTDEDVIEDLANSPCIGNSTIRSHSIAIVKTYHDELGIEASWFSDLQQETINASIQLNNSYGKYRS